MSESVRYDEVVRTLAGSRLANDDSDLANALWRVVEHCAGLTVQVADMARKVAGLTDDVAVLRSQVGIEESIEHGCAGGC